MVRTRESERSAILDQAMLTDLPAGGGRDFIVAAEGHRERRRPAATSRSAGQGRRTANFIADGVSMTGREIRTLDGEFGGGSGLSLETIKELQVITSGFKAETGQTGAGTICVVTKSGTNRYEGSVFGYFRPTALVGDNPITGNPPAKQDRQQWGGVLGGPIVRDQTHFFGTWESTRVNGESVGDLGARAGHLPDAVAHQSGLRPRRSPLQLEQRARCALQPDAQRQRERRHRRAEHVRPPHQQRVGERHRRGVAGQHPRVRTR